MSASPCCQPLHLLRLGLVPCLAAAAAGVALAQESVTVTPSAHDDANVPAPIVGEPHYASDVKLPAQPLETAQEAASKTKWTIAPYLWLYDMSGKVTVRNTTAHFDVPFSDLIDKIDFALMGHVECEFDKWGLFFDGQYGELSEDASVGPIDLKASAAVSILELGAFTHILDRTLDAQTERHFTADALIGARYYGVDSRLDFDPPALPTVDDSEWWVDGFVGARCQWDFASKWSLNARGDVGGFGIGTASNLAWQAQGLIAWQMSKGVTFAGGWRVLDIDRDAGALDWNAQLSGPIFGVVFRF